MNPRAKGRIPGSPSEWLSHARSDLRLAGLAISDEQVRREQLCFHAQQAGEKAIKAVLLAKAIEFPLTHDMEQLLEIAESHGMTLPADVRQAGILSPLCRRSEVSRMLVRGHADRRGGGASNRRSLRRVGGNRAQQAPRKPVVSARVLFSRISNAAFRPTFALPGAVLPSSC
jgi:HEPN domain-containing protein